MANQKLGLLNYNTNSNTLYQGLLIISMPAKEQARIQDQEQHYGKVTAVFSTLQF